jgi:hypothetical protein
LARHQNGATLPSEWKLPDSLAVAVPIHVEKDGEELKEYIHRLKPGLRKLRAYRDLLDREPEFKSGEMTEGYFNKSDKKPIGNDGRPRTIFLTGEYIQYAQEYFGFV